MNRSNNSFSVVTSLYYSAPYIGEFYSRMTAALGQLTDNYEIIFVDDGSPDDSAQLAIELMKSDPRVRLIELSRNFGHAPAMFAGMEHAKGDYVFILDVDLEEKPEWLLTFYEKLTSEPGVDVVFGQMKKRKGKFFERVSGKLYYRFFNFLSESPIPIDQAWARLMKKNYVENLLKFKEAHVYPAGLMYLVGFKQVPIPVEKTFKGTTTYTAYKRFAQAVNAITSFSSKPLFLISIMGLIISLVGLGLAVYFVVLKLFYNTVPLGYTSLIASIWFLSGIIILSIGLIGLYLSKIFIQVKGRPISIVKKIH
jgi:putative glycosyltransferase